MFRLSEEECQARRRNWGAFRNKFRLEPQGRGHPLSSTLGTAEDHSEGGSWMGTHGCAVPRAHPALRPPEVGAVGSRTGPPVWAQDASVSPDRAPSTPKLESRSLALKRAFTKSRNGDSKLGLLHNCFFLEALASSFLFSSWLQIVTSLQLTSGPISSPKLQGKPGMDFFQERSGGHFSPHALLEELLLS